MSSTLTIALVSSPERQLDVDVLRNDLLIQGHIVSNLTPHAAGNLPKTPQGNILLGSDAQFFNQIALLVGMADLFVLFLPADHDAACLAGMAHISGVPVAVISEGLAQECCFSVRGCVNFWCEDTTRLLEVISDWPDLSGEE